MENEMSGAKAQLEFAGAGFEAMAGDDASAQAYRRHGEEKAIRKWLMEGRRLSREHGERMPAAIAAAIEAIFAEPDQIGRFLGEVCETSNAAAAMAAKSGFYEFSAYLFARYTEWCRSAKEPAMSLTGFGRRLSWRGFPPMRRGHARRKARIGIKLRG
jgi:phage/plasmid-associated DNA primase